MTLSSSPAGYPAPAVQWGAVFVLLLLYAFAIIDRQIISLMVPMIRADLGITDFQISLLQGLAFAILFCAFGLPLGYAVDRISRRLVIFLGVLVWAIAATACGLARSFPELITARFFVGVGEAALAPAAFSILSDMFSAKRLTFAISVYSIGSLIGGAAALSISGLIIDATGHGFTLPFLSHLSPWQTTFVVTGAPGFLFAFLIFLIPEPARRASRTVGGSWTDLWTFMNRHRRFFACHMLGFSLVFAIAYANIGWIPTYLMRTFGWSAGKAGPLLGLFNLSAGIASFIFSGLVVDWMLRRGYADAHLRFYVFAMIVCTISGGLAFHASTPALFFLTLLAGKVAVNMAAVAPAALQIVTPSELRGRVSAIYLMATGLIGMPGGPSLVASLTDFVYRDDARINLSMSTTYLILGPIACVLFFFGMKPMREALAARNAAEAAPLDAPLASERVP